MRRVDLYCVLLLRVRVLAVRGEMRLVGSRLAGKARLSGCRMVSCR